MKLGKGSKRLLGIGCFSAAGLVFVAYLTIFLWLPLVFAKARILLEIKESLSAAELAEVRAFLSSPIHYPQEWQDVEPYSLELRSASGPLIAKVLEWTSLPPNELLSRHSMAAEFFRKLNRGEPISATDWDSIYYLIEEASPAIEAISRMVGIPDYEFGSIPVFHPPRDGNELMQLPLIAHTIGLSAHALSKVHNHQGAGGRCLTMFRITKRHPCSESLPHIISLTFQLLAGNTFRAISLKCVDPDQQRTWLGELNRLESEIYLDNFDRIVELELIGVLRSAKRDGVVVDLSPGKPGRFYFRQIIDSGVFGGDALQDLHWLVRKLVMSDIEDLLFADFRPKSGEAAPREKTSHIHFNLLRIATANRILELEGKPKARSVQALVPDFLPHEPLDLFAEKPFLWDSSDEVFYSVGPDRVDDGNLLRYAPTNGVISRGDFSVR